MSFKMHCPKCNTYNYSIERDRYAYSQKNDAAGLVFSCRCGKRMFGKLLVDEYEKQKTTHGDVPSKSAQLEAPGPEHSPADDDKKKVLQEAFRYRAEYIQKKKKEEEDAAVSEKTRRDAEWKTRIAKQESALRAVPPSTDESAPITEPAHVLAADGDVRCQWGDCPNAARKRSKYCSRACSNKNARQRYKARKKSVPIS